MPVELPPNMSMFNRASPELVVPPEVAPPPAPEYPKGYDFTALKEKTKKLADTVGKPAMERAARNRLYRNMEVDNEAERLRGRFKQDEIYIPYRVINDNINKESPSYIKYIIGSPNAAIFKPRNSPAITNQEALQRFFTTGVRYEGHEQEVFGLIDSFQLNGLDYIEVCYDDAKPGYFSYEHLGHENVWYPTKVQRGKFQLTPIVIRNCELTRAELEKFPEVNMDQVNILFKDIPENDPEKEFVCVQKVYYRIQDVVYVCWMAYDKSTDFIRAPKPLFLGRWKIITDEMGMEVSRNQIFENFYPIVPFPYSITENKCLQETLGRARMDENVQEATSSMVSSIVNGYHKASQIMGSPRNPTASGSIASLDVEINGGRLFNQPIDWFNMPYPDMDGMNIVNALLTQNKTETSQINFAVGNRGDYASRKTAQEVKTAERKETELTTTQVVLFSAAWREVLNICWLIMKSQVELGVLQPEGMDPTLFSQDWILLPAGEVEVIQRQETLANLQNIWPVVANTPAAQPVLEDILRLMVPMLADKYIAALQTTDPRLMVQRLAMIIQAIAKEHPEVIPPESYEELNQIMQQVQQISATTEQGKGTTPNANSQPIQTGQPTTPQAAA